MKCIALSACTLVLPHGGNKLLQYDQFFETKNTPRSGNSLEMWESVNIKNHICGLSREIKVLWGINGL